MLNIFYFGIWDLDKPYVNKLYSVIYNLLFAIAYKLHATTFQNKCTGAHLCEIQPK